MIVSNFLEQPCNKSDNTMKLARSLLQTHLVGKLLEQHFHNLIMIISDMLEQPCDKSDNAIKVLTIC